MITPQPNNGVYVRLREEGREAAVQVHKWTWESVFVSVRSSAKCWWDGGWMKEEGGGRSAPVLSPWVHLCPGGHLTVLSLSTEVWLCLKMLSPAPAVRHAWCSTHTHGEYWKCLQKKSNQARGAVGQCAFVRRIYELLQKSGGRDCELNFPKFEKHLHSLTVHHTCD